MHPTAAPQLPVLFVDRDGTLIEEPPISRSIGSTRCACCPACSRRCGAAARRLSSGDGEQPGRARQRALSRASASSRCSSSAAAVRLAGHRVRRGVHLPAPRARAAATAASRAPAWCSEYLREQPLDRDAQRHDRRSRHRSGVRARSRHPRPARARAAARDRGELAGGRAGAARAPRAASCARTRETDDRGRASSSTAARRAASDTGIGFFDHMLEQLAKHGGFQLQLRCRGRSAHRRAPHGRGLRARARRGAAQALGDKAGIGRYGFLLAMDESEAQVAIDLSGRAYFALRGAVRPRAGRRAADRTGAALLSLARRQPRRRAAPERCAARTRTT